MPSENPKYDVAISFLYQDLNLAKAFFDELSKGLNVFFFPRNQEELAGTDGLESMREPFRFESRLSLVLYRPRWGKTSWTGVEETAVKESCLDTSYKSIFFLVIEPTIDFPKWLPETHVRFNYADFSLEQAIGAVKARVRERGGEFAPLTPARKVELLKIEQEYRSDRAYMLSSTEPILKEVKSLFEEIYQHCNQIDSEGHLQIKRTVFVKQREVDQFCTVGAEQVSMTVIWHQPYGGSFEHAALIIRELDQQIIAPPNYRFFHPTKTLRETKYLPDVSRSREYVWQSGQAKESFISTKDLANLFILQFLDLIERDRAGKIRRNRLD
jgi:hypothetical protein